MIRHPVQSLNNNDHKYKKHLYFNINSKHNIISISGGFEIEILKALEAKYHFTSHYIDGRQMWGVRQQNGSWDGMVKQIQDNVSCATVNFLNLKYLLFLALFQDCQVALCSTSRTLERMAVVDYSETTHLDEITFVSLWPDRLSKDLTLALPLERAVWVLTFIAFIVISLLLYFFTSKGKRKPSFSLILLHLLAIYLNKSVELWRGRTLLEGTKDESGSRILFTRMLYCFWAVGSMVLSIGYGCKLYSTLTSPSQAQPLDSVGELLAAVTSDSHNVFVKRNTALWSLIFAASEKNFLYYSLAKHIIRFVKKLTFFNLKILQTFKTIRNPFSKTTTADIKLIKTVREGHNNVAIANRLNIFIMVQKFQTLDKKFHISTETLALDSIGFMLAKKSPLLPFFNKQ